MRIRGWIREDSRMDSHGFPKIPQDSSGFPKDLRGFADLPKIHMDSHGFAKVPDGFTSIRGWIRKDSRKFTYGFAPIHKDSHPIIQSNHGGIRDLGRPHQYWRQGAT